MVLDDCLTDEDLRSKTFFGSSVIKYFFVGNPLSSLRLTEFSEPGWQQLLSFRLSDWHETVHLRSMI
jgi:hypothetical protein